MTTSLTALLEAKRSHLARLSSSNGSQGESAARSTSPNWIARPKGQARRNLLTALKRTGIEIKATAFDFISLPESQTISFDSEEDLFHRLPQMTFIEVKTATQKRVKPGFSGFFFAFTENEISASTQLGDRYKIALFNKHTKELLISSLPEVMGRAGSTTWQVSIQLRPAE
ncbi:DUF3883 domain-containing protein [Lysobacter capsici]|uniref:hypothetical protein n=1 Tax=Lysobacter capsici TaxID=435897 RepID=UPI0017811505|nr:hypothetical protein [Lysobacter capsici]UOF14910.1 DUF3883 domain-containing protein [Lysobacter capsici]